MLNRRHRWYKPGSGQSSFRGNWGHEATDGFKRNSDGRGGGDDLPVQLLIPCDGTAASTTFLDISDNGFTVTANGNAQIDRTLVDPYGSNTRGVLICDGAGDFLSVADNAALEPGSGDFTMEGWVRSANVGITQVIYGKRADNLTAEGFYIGIVSQQLVFTCDSGGNTYDIALNASFSANLVNNTWYHFAVVREGNTWTGYVDGVGTTVSTSSAGVGDTTAAVRVGGDSNGFYLNGYADDIRYTSSAVYTGNFTPPTSPLQPS